MVLYEGDHDDSDDENDDGSTAQKYLWMIW
jgi:hypothetical protein